MIDRQLRKDIAAEVSAAVRASLAQIEERWLTAQELCEHFGMFSMKWLKEYGDLLPRERISVTDMNGETRRTHWAYPMHEINRMILAGELRGLKVMKM